MIDRVKQQIQNARLAGVLLSMLVLSLLTGCASGPRLASPSEMGVPQRVMIEGIPFHAQQEYQCGPASLAMVLNASHVDVDVDTLIPQVFLPGREGSVQPEMQAAVRRYQRISFVLDGTFESLLRELAAGYPVVVMQNLSLPAWPMWHYAVAIGYDLGEEVMTLHSGEQANRLESLRRFDATWARSNRWAMVALPPGELPVSIDEHKAAESIAAFEQVAGISAALPAWQAVVERWPTYAMGWFALGNTTHAEGNLSAAASAFKQAVELRPDLAAGWLNLGLTLESLNQRDEAITALRRAIRIEGKWQAQAESALQRLQQPLND